jgi:uncharacterized protein (DUF1786 family)
MPLLAVDVGAGTQDILLCREDIPLEGSTKMVLPSPTLLMAGRIDRARSRGIDVFLEGPTMGGGSSTAAVMRHLAAGLKVYATPAAAATIGDNLGRVAQMGVTIQEEAPARAERISTGDIDIPALKTALGLFDIDLPNEIAVAVQDHGFSPDRSNRLVRFEQMAEAIRAGGRIENFAYRQPPNIMTRMQAVNDYLTCLGYVPLLMDTGPAALFGVVQDPHFVDPCLIMNFGNGHTVAAVVYEGRITALFEHHTSELDPEKLRRFASELCDGTLTNSDVFDDGGHGAFIECVPDKVRSTLITGPRRDMFLQSGVLEGAVAAAPAGDMMITGCIGLREAWLRKDRLWR